MESQLWRERINSDSDFTFFRRIHTGISPPIIYHVSNEHSFLQVIDGVTRIWARRPLHVIHEELTCLYCNNLYADPICHMLSNCNRTKQLRVDLKLTLLKKLAELTVKSIFNLNDELFVFKLLGANVGLHLEKEHQISLLYDSFKFIAKCKKQFDKMF